MADSQRKTANLFNGTIEYGSFQADGSLSNYTETRVRSSFYDKLPSGTYTINVTGVDDVVLYCYTQQDTSTYVDISEWRSWQQLPFTFTITEPLYVRFALRKSNNSNINIDNVGDIMFNVGSTPLPYEPYGWLHSLRKLGTATDTITTLPADLYADGNNATVGLVGNMSQSGTPTPQNPIQPSECGERTENLFDVSDFTYTIGSSSQNRQLWTGKLPAGTYTVSINQDSALTSSTRNTLVVTINGTPYYESTLENYHNNAGLHRMIFDVNEGDVIAVNYWAHTLSDNCTFSNAMLNTGSTALPYEPYGYKLPIKSANTTTPVYLGEVQTTRKIKKLVFDGTEDWTKNDVGNPSNYLYYQTGYLANKTCVCSHLEDMGTLSTSKVGVFNGNNVLYLNFGSAIMNAQPSGNTVEGLKQYLAAQYAAGTPVCVWYVLADSTTGIVNEPLRKIGDYADTVSGISIPTITGADSFDVLTTLKPSEASLSYTGWHDASVKEWDGSQWQ